MATHTNYALRVPASLMEDLRVASERDGVSMNMFIVQAIAEKIAMLRARGLLHDLSPEEQSAYFEQRLRTAGEDRFKDVLAVAGTTAEILPGDEIPNGWLPERGTADEASASTG